MNDVVPQRIVGVLLGVRLDWAASDIIQLGGSAGWLGHWSFVDSFRYSGLPLLLGAPWSTTELRVDATVRLSGPARVRVGWAGELATLEVAYRSYQALTLAFDYTF
jgi:hypothetical protein